MVRNALADPYAETELWWEPIQLDSSNVDGPVLTEAQVQQWLRDVRPHPPTRCAGPLGQRRAADAGLCARAGVPARHRALAGGADRARRRRGPRPPPAGGGRQGGPRLLGAAVAPRTARGLQRGHAAGGQGAGDGAEPHDHRAARAVRLLAADGHAAGEHPPQPVSRTPRPLPPLRCRRLTCSAP